MTIARPRGVLNLQAGAGRFELSRCAPSPDLLPFIEHYWAVDWDLRGRDPHRQDVLSHPSVHMVLEAGRLEVFGVIRTKYVRILDGAGRVFGVKFRPGAFHPFVISPVSRLTDRRLDAETLFGEPGKVLADRLREQVDFLAMIEVAESFLRDRRPEPDAQMVESGRIAHRIMVDRTIRKVDDLLPGLAISKRTLQRLFEQYVGVPPKWLIQRYRLHEAVERLDLGEPVDWARMALDLGYFDHSHFINDFKSLVGLTPAEYAGQLHPRL